ncbi:uncharacterized protein [Dysidea avara]|uniref:uncharacterized protein isoform X2 n=1 Tax=Dysidea avara TaxID=196820 RepID=UPI0033273F0A
MVDYFYSAVTLTNRQQEVDILHLLIRTLALIKTLNISGCSITDQGTDLVTAIIHKASSLEELDISHANLNSLKCITISRALKNISSLRFFRINNNFITEEATDSIIEAVCSNFLLEELKLSNNQLTSVAVTQIITTVSISNAIKVLDISKNCVSLNNVDNLSSAVRNCHTLQELKLSQNSLLFTGIICISEALRGHPNLKYLNVEKNVMSYFSETEFLVDVILSANEPLLYLNVCGRNIRPRFVEDHLVPPCGHEKQNNFVIQNLYLSCLVLNHVLKLIQNVEELSDMHNDNVIKVSEKCPITNEGISVYCVDNDGGTFYNKAHNFAIIIPPGAVLQGDRVQMQATASRFGPFQLPEGYYPISSFFWISADYTFKLPVYLILSHHASPRNLNELQKLRAMKASAQNTCPNGKQKLLMNEVVSGAFFDYKIGYCVISTCHFCSHCSTTDDITIPNIFHALYYMYNFKRCLMAEVCICHANRECIEVVETQYNNKKAELIRGLAFSFNSEQHLTINVDPIKLSAWDMTIETKKISYSQFNFRTHTKDTLEKMESVGSYPPRFVVTYCTKNVPYEPLSSKITVSTGEEWGATFQVNDISDILQVPTISTKPPPIPFSETALQKEKESLLKKTPKMGDLVTIVIPKIKAEWEEVAYALYFDSPEVSAIGLKCLWDPKKCCREVFIDWIERGRGISPKTWSELLNRLKKIELVKAAEDIFKELHVIT